MRTIGQIKPEIFYAYKMAFNKVTQEYQVTDKEGFVWATGKTTKGAIITACNQGIPLRQINIQEAYVPIKQVIEAIK